MPFGILSGIGSGIEGLLGKGGGAVGGGLIGGALGALSSAFSNKSNAANAAAYNAPLEAGLAQAKNIANTPFQQYTGQLTAPLSAQEQQAANLAGTTAAESQAAYKQALTPFSGAAVQQYENPYAQAVTNPALQKETLNYQDQLADIQRKANMSDAFGYGRTAAMEAPLNQAFAQQYADTEQSGLANAYKAAENEFNQQQGAFAGLGERLGSAGSNGVGSLLSTGKDIREAGTQADQAQYGEFKRGQDWSRQQFQPYLSMLQTAYKGGLQQPAYTNPLSAAIGGAMTGAGLGMQFGKGATNNGGPNGNQLGYFIPGAGNNGTLGWASANSPGMFMGGGGGSAFGA